MFRHEDLSGQFEIDGEGFFALPLVGRILSAGMTARQLEGEIEQGAWFVVDADPKDPFTGDPEGLWRSVLARQRPELARFALVPDDPTVN